MIALESLVLPDSPDFSPMTTFVACDVSDWDPDSSNNFYRGSGPEFLYGRSLKIEAQDVWSLERSV